MALFWPHYKNLINYDKFWFLENLTRWIAGGCLLTSVPAHIFKDRSGWITSWKLHQLASSSPYTSSVIPLYPHSKTHDVSKSRMENSQVERPIHNRPIRGVPPLLFVSFISHYISPFFPLSPYYINIYIYTLYIPLHPISSSLYQLKKKHDFTVPFFNHKLFHP